MFYFPAALAGAAVPVVVLIAVLAAACAGAAIPVVIDKSAFAATAVVIQIMHLPFVIKIVRLGPALLANATVPVMVGEAAVIVGSFCPAVAALAAIPMMIPRFLSAVAWSVRVVFVFHRGTFLCSNS
jgi:hypothetical protein